MVAICTLLYRDFIFKYTGVPESLFSPAHNPTIPKGSLCNKPISLETEHYLTEYWKEVSVLQSEVMWIENWLRVTWLFSPLSEEDGRIIIQLCLVNHSSLPC